MLRELKPSDIPSRYTGSGTAAADFANKAIGDFEKSGYEAAEIDGWPDGMGKGKKDVARLVNALRQAAWNFDTKVKVMQRGERVFLVREEVKSG